MSNQNKFYEKHVSDYQKVTNLWFPKRHLKLINAINRQPQAVLDVGCGTGVMLERIEHKYPAAGYYGIDLSPGMIEYAKSAHPRYEFAVADAESLPFGGALFDVVTNAISFHHYPHPQQAINEAYRVLRPNGQFLLMDIMPKHATARMLNDFAARYVVRDGHVGFRSHDSVRSMFEKAGFKNIRQIWVGLPGVYIASGNKDE